MRLRKILRNAQTKLKLARRDRDGQITAYTGVSLYDEFVRELPSGWKVSSSEDVNTKEEGGRPAWVISSKDAEVAAVAHETGIEVFVIPILIGAAGDLVAMAVGALTVKAWEWWRKKVPPQAGQELVIIIERVETRDAEGNVHTASTTVVSGVPDAKAIAEHLLRGSTAGG